MYVKAPMALSHFQKEKQVTKQAFSSSQAYQSVKEWKYTECQKSGGAGGTASCRGYRGRAPNPCAAALSPQTSVALFAGNGGQLGVFRQTASPAFLLEKGGAGLL